MKTYTAEELKTILAKHRLWLEDNPQGERANLSGANLSKANLSGANLYKADLSGADLSKANLSGANLSEADLSGANLSKADLSKANLSGANLYKANLSRAYLSGADLSGANLSKANLSGANLYRADLSRANLSKANLSGANLYKADLSGAIFSGKDISYIRSFTDIVSEGDIIVWKAAHRSIIKLFIPKEAKRINYISSRKCRAEYAKVLEILDKLTGSSLTAAKGLYDISFEYKADAIVKPDSFDDDVRNECSHGIHFFLTRQEAERWNG